MVDKIKQRAIEMFRNGKDIDVIKIASEEGINVVAEDSDTDYNAHIEFDPASNKFTIFVNANHSYNRVKFSIAHELSHYILHQDLIKKHLKVHRSNSDHLDANAEREANELAAEILMPEPVLKEQIELLNDSNKIIDSSVLNKLILIFKVSREALSIRLDKLGYVLVN